MKLVCASCSDPQVMAFSPGHEAYEVAGVVIERPSAPKAWCEACWRRWHCSPQQAILFTELPSVTKGDRQAKVPGRLARGFRAKGNGGPSTAGRAPGGATAGEMVALGNTAKSGAFPLAPIRRAKNFIAELKVRCPIRLSGVACPPDHENATVHGAGTTKPPPG